ncbi:HEPN domain-containing protein [Raoultella ornithinolytica]|uniref:HEPN domain-containing protein n=1 Tax=Raoultella ornithinolytica TaxID=54291 RepID=UPI0013C2F7F8|nr:HEPN domain-containing protein [Raoultella ornithinolytica]CAE6345305.1 hypothetical protein AI2711V1_2412 [Raoultella ornithinolytica]CAH3507605.1 hypothetical protein AI2711V1_2412 [Raoultella ornithinolytica]
MFEMELMFVFDGDSSTVKGSSDVVGGIKRNVNFSFVGDEFIYKERKYNLSVLDMSSEDDKNRVCLVKVFSSSDVEQTIDNASVFIILCDEVIKNVKEIKNKKILPVLNTACSFLAMNAYYILNSVENNMRKLITIFMTVKVGDEWFLDNIPQEVIDSIKGGDENKEGLNILFNVDFIQIFSMFFSGYKTILDDELHRRLIKGDILVDEIKDRYLPRSNWERYFSSWVGVGYEKTLKKWKVLYELRNEVAHNRFLSYNSFLKIKGIGEEINKITQSAIDSLINLEVTDKEAEDIQGVIKDIALQPSKNNISKSYELNGKVLDSLVLANGSVLPLVPVVGGLMAAMISSYKGSIMDNMKKQQDNKGDK